MSGNSIKLFQFIQKYFRAIGIHPPEPNQIKQNSFNAKNWFFLIGLMQLLVPTLAFLLFDIESMLDIGLSVYFSAGLGFCEIYYIICFCQVKNISKLIEKCEMFVEQRKHSRIIYDEFNWKVEILCKWFSITYSISVILYIFAVLLYSAINYYVFHFGEESFYLPYSTIMLPFQWKTPFGYLLAWFNTFFGALTGILSAPPFYNSIFASSWLFVIIADDDLKEELAAFNNDVKTSKGSDRAEIRQRFYSIIQSYWDAKELINRFNYIHRFSIFAFFCWAIFGICGILLTLQFQLWDDNSKLIELIFSSVMASWTMIYMFLVCEPGQRVSEAFAAFYDMLEQCDWHLLPTPHTRRLYLIFLLDTQQPINIKCFGGILCTRETFKGITNSGFSNFMVLRQIGQL